MWYGLFWHVTYRCHPCSFKVRFSPSLLETSVLAGTPTPPSVWLYTICNNPSQRLADIVHFDLLRMVVSLMILKESVGERSSHPYLSKRDLKH